jgi:hypothetical protein
VVQEGFYLYPLQAVGRYKKKPINSEVLPSFTIPSRVDLTLLDRSLDKSVSAPSSSSAFTNSSCLPAIVIDGSIPSPMNGHLTSSTINTGSSIPIPINENSTKQFHKDVDLTSSDDSERGRCGTVSTNDINRNADYDFSSTDDKLNPFRSNKNNGLSNSCSHTKANGRVN